MATDKVSLRAAAGIGTAFGGLTLLACVLWRRYVNAKHADEKRVLKQRIEHLESNHFDGIFECCAVCRDQRGDPSPSPRGEGAELEQLVEASQTSPLSDQEVDEKLLAPLLDVPYWKKRNIYFPRPSELTERLKGMLSKGFNNLQVISDFDRTLSPARNRDGSRGKTCHGILENSEWLSQEYREAALALYNKFYPLEMSNAISKEDRLRAMEEWWSTAHKLLIEHKMRKEFIERTVRTSDIELRCGCKEVMRSLNHLRVPLLVFSAGLSDVCEEVLRHMKLDLANVKVLANRMQFDEEGCLKGWGPLVHSLNKNYESVERQLDSFAHSCKTRAAVLTIGDSLGDATMSNGIEKLVHNPLEIKIGLLNDHINEKRLQTYMKHFDVVIVNDSSFQWVNFLIKAFARCGASGFQH